MSDARKNRIKVKKMLKKQVGKKLCFRHLKKGKKEMSAEFAETICIK